jgi:hypothetical protein
VADWYDIELGDTYVTFVNRLSSCAAAWRRWLLWPWPVVLSLDLSSCGSGPARQTFTKVELAMAIWLPEVFPPCSIMRFGVRCKGTAAIRA